ncbi:hypothetical protein LCGC14_1837210 [marine sediment metagenome]|uniref:Uncharacterized protein n=1 Tax=marine sediment metagenome TaxID=412755 RepID=A0A0F9JDQ1_9ZZZZ
MSNDYVAIAGEALVCPKCRIACWGMSNNRTCDHCGAEFAHGRACGICNGMVGEDLRCTGCGREYEWHDEPVLMLSEDDVAKLRLKPRSSGMSKLVAGYPNGCP